jgi:hypothetical protein
VRVNVSTPQGSSLRVNRNKEVARARVAAALSGIDVPDMIWVSDMPRLV